jgi:hypothetical protein
MCYVELVPRVIDAATQYRLLEVVWLAGKGSHVFETSGFYFIGWKF